MMKLKKLKLELRVGVALSYISMEWRFNNKKKKLRMSKDEVKAVFVINCQKLN